MNEKGKELIEEWDELSNHYKIWEEEKGHGWKTKYEYTCQLTTKDGKVYEAKGASPDDAVDNALDMRIKFAGDIKCTVKE